VCAGIVQTARGRTFDDACLRPIRVGEVDFLPAPGILRSIDLLAGPDGHKRPQGCVVHRNDGIGPIMIDFPFGVGIDLSGRCIIALKQEAGMIGNLCPRFIVGIVPDDGGQYIRAGFQVRGEIHGFVTPVR